jgi:hypothetical protein
MKPHKHAELIKAWADGHTVQYKDGYGWWDWDYPDWDGDDEYRIKPESKPDVVKVFVLESHCLAGLRFSESTPIEYGTKDKQFIKCNFDGETGKIKSVEVLK